MQPLAHSSLVRRAEASVRLAAVVVDAPALAARDALRSAGLGEPAFAWAPRADGEDEQVCIGWGTAARVDGAGEARWDEIRTGATRLFERIEGAGALPFEPRLFGGFAFDRDAGSSPRDARRERSERARRLGGDGARSATVGGTPWDISENEGDLALVWDAFGAASFVLPRILYACSGESAVLVAFVPESETGSVRTLLDGARRSLEAAKTAEFGASGGVREAGGSGSGGGASGGVREGVNGADRGGLGARDVSVLRARDVGADGRGERAYCELVGRALLEIERRAFAKVVLCRARHLAFSQRIDAARAFAFLDERHVACARFLFDREGAQFVGASPERLVFVHGRRVVTEALAGSRPRLESEGEGDARAELFASDKDRAEHAFVVAAIREALAPLCEGLSIAEVPQVRALAHVFHLATPIVGTLAGRSHVLDVARRLHPTPALCGTPRTASRAFLLANEAQPRGWYGGCVGWFDAAGDGAFAVAIRSALVAAKEAWIYAGAGIVHGSDPERELAETLVKERAMRDALEAS